MIKNIEHYRWVLVLMIILAPLSKVSYSHSPEHKKEPISKHGGIAKRAGPYNIEFVSDGKCASLYVNAGDNTELSTKRSFVETVIKVKGVKYEFVLEPSEGNRLYGCSDAIITEAKLAKMRIKMYGKEPISKLLILR